MKVKVRPRAYPDRVVWTCDVHVVPAGGETTERYRLVAPDQVTTRAGAERWALRQAAAIAADGPPVKTRRAKAARAAAAEEAERERVPTLGEWWPEYMRQLEVERRKPGGQRVRIGIWRNWLSPLAGLDLRACCSELEIRRLRSTVAASPGSSPKRINFVVGRLLTCLRYAARVRPELGLEVPAVKPIRVDDDDEITMYTLEQIAALLAAARPRERAAVLLMLDAGLRAGEVCALRWSAVDLARLRLDVVATEYKGQLVAPKSGKPRTVPMTRRLAGAMAALGPGDAWVFPAPRRPGPCRYGALSHRIHRLCDAAAVERLGCHALRHKYATEALRAGVDLRTLQAWLGHANIMTTSRYLHPAGIEDRRAVDALEARLDPAPCQIRDSSGEPGGAKRRYGADLALVRNEPQPVAKPGLRRRGA